MGDGVDIGAWLRGLGLGQYEPAFRDNDVDARVLPGLTAEDLKEIGVASVGHRKRLLRGIAALRPGPASSGTAPPPLVPASEAERRQLTVLFADLVGSTPLSARLDPEDLRELVGAFHARVAGTIEEEGGFVAKYMGDGVLAYFGWPQAHEDEAERAIRAGLNVVAAVRELSAPVAGAALRVRIGIATGIAVVGDLLGSGAAREEAVVGETPNLAARLQALAEPGSVVIAEGTRRLIGDLFECADLGMVDVKGFADPVRAYRVLGPGVAASRFEALHATGALTPLVGRKEELSLLLRRWEQVRGGEGRVVLLPGEAGVGKSRLLAALQERLADEPHVALRYFCSPHHQDSVLRPVIAQLEHAAGFARGDPPEAKLAKLKTLLTPASPPSEDVALLAELLSLPAGGRYAAPPLAPERKRERTFAALLRQLEKLATGGPVLLVFEDVHWIDPSTRELLELVVERAVRLPVLLLATFRPEFRPPWTGQSHVTLLALSRLGRREGAALVGYVAGSATLPEAVVTEIVERTDGVPLFAEELTKAVLEAGAASAPAAPTIPATLHASLLARLDRLGPQAKGVAQVGAVIGREFSHDLLAAIAGQREDALAVALERLTRAGLMFRHGAGQEAGYLFKHALVRDAAYGTLLRDRRRRLHAAVASTLKERFPELVAAAPELLAHHLTEAGLHEGAAPYWRRAGEQALHRSAAREAIAHFSAALAASAAQRESSERNERELHDRLGLATAISLVHGPADTAYAEQCARAVTLARRLGDDRPLFRAVWGSWFAKQNTGQGEHALALAHELVALAERIAEDDLLLEAYHSRWASSHLAGHHAMVLSDTARGITLYDPVRHHEHTYAYGGHDTGVCARAQNAITLWLTGFPEKAARTAVEAVALGRRLGHPQSLSHGAWWTAVLWQLQGAPAACREFAELTLRIEREQGSGKRFMCPLLLGWVRFEEGEQAAGLRDMETHIAAARRHARRFYFDYELLVFAQALLKSGEQERASEVVAEALEFIEVSGSRLYEAEAHRLKGACLAAMGEKDMAEAERWLASAVAISQRQGALPLALRAAMSLARLRCDRGQHAGAGADLRLIYGSFTEGFGTPELENAKVLLEEIASASPGKRC